MKLIKSVFALFFVLSTAAATASVHEDHPYEFDIRRDPYQFATFFQINSHDTYIGTVKKSSFRIRTNYDLSDANGWQATGIKRVLDPVVFFTWGSKIDIYDTRDEKVGVIYGALLTWEHAAFNLYEYDEKGNYICAGIAYLDRDYDSFTILFPDGGPHPIAKIERQQVSIDGAVDFWKVSVYHPERIDDRIVRIFAAFVLDYQDNFRKPGSHALKDDEYDDEYEDDVY